MLSRKSKLNTVVISINIQGNDLPIEYPWSLHFSDLSFLVFSQDYTEQGFSFGNRTQKSSFWKFTISLTCWNYLWHSHNRNYQKKQETLFYIMLVFVGKFLKYYSDWTNSSQFKYDSRKLKNKSYSYFDIKGS